MRPLLTFALLIITLISTAQTNSDSIANHLPDYESITLDLYNQKNWDNLLITGKEAIKAGYDYFNVRVRTGAAAFHLQKYSLSAKHLEKAVELNNKNDYANELLYYAYTFTGRKPHAGYLTRNFSPDLNQEFSKKFMNPTLYIEAGPVISNHTKKTGNIDENNSTLFTEKYSEQNAFYLVAGLKKPLGNNIIVDVAVSQINLSKHRSIYIRDVDSLNGDFKVKQTEFYISPAVCLNKRLQLIPAIRFARTDISEPILSNDSITNLYLGNPIGIRYNNFIIGGKAIYSHNYWQADVGMWHLTINDSRSMQYSASVMVLPFGNLNLYSISGLSYMPDRANQPFIATQTIGFKTFNKTWLELSGTKGNLLNTVEQNAQLLNNQVVESNYRIASLLIYDLNKQIRLTLRYQLIENDAATYFSVKNYEIQRAYTTYFKHIITGGITWNIK